MAKLVKNPKKMSMAASKPGHPNNYKPFISKGSIAKTQHRVDKSAALKNKQAGNNLGNYTLDLMTLS